MQNLRFDWHEHIKEIEGEYHAARIAVDRLKSQVIADSGLLEKDERARLRDADRNLEGTYLVRLFATFEAALRSYDRARRNDPNRNVVASVLIDSVSGRRGQGIQRLFKISAPNMPSILTKPPNPAQNPTRRPNGSTRRH